MTSPDNLASARQMPGWLKNGLLATLLVGLCWGGAISYWRTTGSMPGTEDLALCLLGLPLLVMLAFWLGRELIAMRTASPTAAAPSRPAEAAAAPSQAQALAILAVSLRSPQGTSPEELAAAIADNKARADLDQELVDADGFPVMTARSADAVDEALHEEIKEWLAQNGMADLHFSDEQWRALTLATAVAGELASRAAIELISTERAAPKLQLIPILPTEWRIAQCRASGMWLKHTVAQFGWPTDQIAVDAEVTADPQAAIPSAIFGRLMHHAATSNAPLAAMMVASASNIGEETVAQWAASGTLFTAPQPQGAIPGEGAAGLLVTDLRLAQSIKSEAFGVVDTIEEARRDSSADETRRADPKLLGELTERALTRAGADSSGVAMIVADTGHRSSRVLELMGHASATMPHLDGADDVVRAGVACGTCGAVPFITALALARHYALERQAPILCFSNEDSYHRCAVLIQPSGSLS